MQNKATYNFAVAIALGLGTVLSVAASVSASRTPASTASTIQLGVIRVTPDAVRDLDTVANDNATVNLGTIRVTPASDSRYALESRQAASTTYLGVVHVTHARAMAAATDLIADRHPVALRAVRTTGSLVFGRTGG